MKPITALFVLSTLCVLQFVVVAGHGHGHGHGGQTKTKTKNAVSGGGDVNLKLIEEACQYAPHKDLCIQTLKVDPNSKGADLTGLAFITIRLAAAYAADVDQHMRSLLIHNATTLEPVIQQGLSDCIEYYSDANEQLDDCVAAMSTNNFKDVEVWVNVAIADAGFCDSALGGQKTVIGQKNEEFRESCSNILAILKVLEGSK